MHMNIIVKVPGSCGELVQGYLNDKPFLITCPIDRFTFVTVSDHFNEYIGLRWKSKLMLERTLKYLGYKKFPFGIKIESQLPAGKGMASSSADIVAVAKAVATALNERLSSTEIANLAVNIEPTDGIFYEGIVAMNPVTGKVFKKYSVPQHQIAIFDFGDKVNTLEFHRQSNLHIKHLPDNLDLSLMEISALANQSIIHKPKLREIISYSKFLDSIGVNIAHTGTVIGIIFHKEFADIHSCIDLISNRFPHIKFLTLANLISGGFQIIRN